METNRPVRNGYADRVLFAVVSLFFSSLASAVPITFTETVFDTTARPNSAIGLGNQVFSGGLTYLTFEFTGDTDNVYFYTVQSAGQPQPTSGYRLDIGTANVTVHDVNNNVTVTANFDPGQIYISTDITNGGLGFSSVIYPIYPYALFALEIDLTDPTFDLQHAFDYSYRPMSGRLPVALSCVSLADGCLNRDTNAANYGLATDKGDFWVTWQALTSATLRAEVSAVDVPEPAPILLFPLGFLVYAMQRSILVRRAGPSLIGSS